MADEEKNETTEETPEVAADAPAAETPAEEPTAEAETPAAEEAPVEQPAAEAATEEPAAEAPATEAPAAEAPAVEPAADATPAPQSQPKKKSKRPPRSLRPQKTRPKREVATERKPISREEKPEHDRGRRQERRGVVVSDAMDKTIVVKVESIRSHPKYKKVIRRSTKFHAHDEQNSAHVGDVVRIVETRPLSKSKHWRLAEIVEVAK
jgi:small subunit ribosomal protein S17